MNLSKLKEPLESKWRVQSKTPPTNPTHVIMVAYIDSRDVQNRLDEVVGAENWQSKFYECKGKQFCEIGIKIDGEWVWKSDSGSESKTEKEKGETSDAFKRAAVQWGINRVAYSYGTVKLKAKQYGNQYYPCTDSGSFLKGEKLYDECNKMAKVEDFQDEYLDQKESITRDIALEMAQCKDRNDLVIVWQSLTEKEQAMYKPLFDRYEF